MSKAKYQRGRQIGSLTLAISYINDESIFYIPGGSKFEHGYKTVPAAFLRNWSLCQLQNAIRHGRLFLAERKETI